MSAAKCGEPKLFGARMPDEARQMDARAARRECCEVLRSARAGTLVWVQMIGRVNSPRDEPPA